MVDQINLVFKSQQLMFIKYFNSLVFKLYFTDVIPSRALTCTHLFEKSVSKCII